MTTEKDLTDSTGASSESGGSSGSTGTLKAFRVNEYEAWAGTSLQHAIEVAAKETMIPIEEVFEEGYGDEIPPETKLNDDNGHPSETTVGDLLAVMEKEGPGPICFYE